MCGFAHSLALIEGFDELLILAVVEIGVKDEKTSVVGNSLAGREVIEENDSVAVEVMLPLESLIDNSVDAADMTLVKLARDVLAWLNEPEAKDTKLTTEDTDCDVACARNCRIAKPRSTFMDCEDVRGEMR